MVRNSASSDAYMFANKSFPVYVELLFVQNGCAVGASYIAARPVIH
jgi:hypothetical protein